MSGRSTLKRAAGNWVTGDAFFDREAELRILRANIRDGAHTLLTAPRRMGKTSLVREALARLDGNPEFHTIFVDLDPARDPADAIVKIPLAARERQSAPRRALGYTANLFRRI